MTRPRTVTHAYRLAGGWEKVRHRALDVEYAQELRAQGYTMVLARRGPFDRREISLNQFLPQG